MKGADTTNCSLLGLTYGIYKTAIKRVRAEVLSLVLACHYQLVEMFARHNGPFQMLFDAVSVVMNAALLLCISGVQGGNNLT